jgi:hypothetical protein
MAVMAVMAVQSSATDVNGPSVPVGSDHGHRRSAHTCPALCTLSVAQVLLWGGHGRDELDSAAVPLGDRTPHAAMVEELVEACAFPGEHKHAT